MNLQLKDGFGVEFTNREGDMKERWQHLTFYDACHSFAPHAQ